MSGFPEGIDWDAARAEEAKLSRAELLAFVGLLRRPTPDLYVERTDAGTSLTLDESDEAKLRDDGEGAPTDSLDVDEG
jgi:hypothetical protein